jgi:transketolase
MSGHSTERVLRGGAASADDRARVLRALAMDAVQQAQSGHPGAPMGMAEMAVALWADHLRHDPADPQWPDRDRFVLSNGHASMLLYALLHLTGYDLPMDELKRFRQLGSRTPGHPEWGHTPGVETTTGPLGQGLANAVGMALAEQRLAAEFNRPGHTIVDHHTYVFLGDGCLMEGISHEVCSLAGVWGLNKLVALYDDNGISIDGPVQGWFRDDTAARFKAYGWQVIGPVDGHDVAAVGQAITQAQASKSAPTLILCRTTIGQGSPNRAGTAKAHGEPLGTEEVARTREAIGWAHAAFEVPADVQDLWDARRLGAQRHAQWASRWASYRAAHPALADELSRRWRGEAPPAWAAMQPAWLAEVASASAAVATRKASQQALAVLGPAWPELLGGSADLTASNLTDFPDCGPRHISHGVREFGMAAILNGVALHGGFIPYGGTFLTFSDYSRNALRMAALMKQRVIHVFTHDSIGLGEDGPTHQPVEHAASLRLIPNLEVWRPCDAYETAVAWALSLERRDGPSALLLSRQALPAQPRQTAQRDAVRRGGYVLSDREHARAVLLATGSEVALAMAAQAQLDEQGVPVRVVSLPCTTLFDRQDVVWQRAVLGQGLPRIGVEAGVTRWWGQYGCVGALGVDRYGESAPGPVVFEHLGLTPRHLVRLVREAIDQSTEVAVS